MSSLLLLMHLSFSPSLQATSTDAQCLSDAFSPTENSSNCRLEDPAEGLTISCNLLTETQTKKGCHRYTHLGCSECVQKKNLRRTTCKWCRETQLCTSDPAEKCQDEAYYGPKTTACPQSFQEKISEQGYVPIGLHGTSALSLQSILQDGIKVEIDHAKRATAYQLLGPGFYMLSLAWGKELAGPALTREARVYAKQAETTTKSLFIRGPQQTDYGQSLLAAYEAAKSADKSGEMQVPLKLKEFRAGISAPVIIILGAKTEGLATMQGFALKNPACQQEYERAVGAQGAGRKVVYDEEAIDEKAAFVLSPTHKHHAEIVARQTLAEHLTVLGFYCVNSSRFVDCLERGLCKDLAKRPIDAFKLCSYPPED